MRVWRLSLDAHRNDAFDGKGAALYGGRWNPKGLAVVYASETLALAALEFFVSLNSRRRIPLVAISADIPATIKARIVGGHELPPDWRARRPSESTRAIGAAWLAARRSAVMSVPSVLIPEERNYLINPAHPDFAKISISAPRPFP